MDVLAQYATSRLTVAAAGYDYPITNLMERYQVATSSFRLRNRGEARLRGVELELQSALAHGFSLGVSDKRRAAAPMARRHSITSRPAR